MKPARLFTTEERNNKNLKQKYYRRNQIWQIMVKQSRRGLTPEQAANEIYMVYGVRTSVTKINWQFAQFTGGTMQEGST